LKDDEVFTQREERSFQGLEVRSPDDEPEIVQTEVLQDLVAICSPDVQLVTWKRTLSAILQAWLEQLDVSCLPYFRILIQPKELRSAMEILLDEGGMPKDEVRSIFISDIDELVSFFADITQSDLVDVCLEHVEHDACWKFHRDCVEARLLTTYRGPATEWVKPKHAQDAIRFQKQYQGPIERFQTHAVGIFKGSCADTGSGIVHRSPPISGTGQNRLFLCLNKPSNASPMPWSG
jgi:hypothetical protein